MKEAIKSIIDWNITCGNSGKMIYSLESSMLIEELSETIIALKNGDKIEAVDGILDVFWVGIGTLYKLGLNADQIYNSFKEIEASNYSKLIKDGDGYKVLKDETGKIMKPNNYFKPDLSKFI